MKPSNSSQPPGTAPSRQAPFPPPSPASASGGPVPPRGEDFDISTLPSSSGNTHKKLLPPHWNRAWLVVVGLLVAYCFYFLVYGMGVRAQKPLPVGPIKTGNTVTAPTMVTVHVAGAVARPGVYSVGANARIADAISQAGGVTPDAETTALNMAAFVQDGAQIVVPIRSATAPNVAPTVVSAPNTSTMSAGVPPTSTNGPPTTTPTTASDAARADQIAYLRAHPIDLNLASSFELQQLPGIGPAMAEDIIAYRTNNGLFRSVADLDNVKGIGEKRMETLRDLVVVR